MMVEISSAPMSRRKGRGSELQDARGKILTKDVSQNAEGKKLRKEIGLAASFFCKIL